jgi:hypothetical protein
MLWSFLSIIRHYSDKPLDPANYPVIRDFGLEVALTIKGIPPAQNVSYLQ